MSFRPLKRPKKAAIWSWQNLPRLRGVGLAWVLAWFGWVFVVSLCHLLADFYRWQISPAWWQWLLWLPSVLLAGVLLWSLVSLLWLRFWSPFLSQLSLVRTLNHNLPIHQPSKVVLTMKATTPPPTWLKFFVMDNAPSNSDIQDLPIVIGAGDFTSLDGRVFALSVHYHLVPNARGLGDFLGADLCLLAPLGLWACYCPVDVAGTAQVRVLADFRSVMSGQLLAMAQKSAINGMMKRRRRGQGQDFHQIRSYGEGDSLRHIDWRATSRLRRLMSKEYQDEQEQSILFLLDASQQMRHQRLVEIDGRMHPMRHLDMALNAMLLLASLANNQGDATGFVSFSGKNDKIAPPKKGGQLINYLLNQSFDIDTSLKMPDYITVAHLALSLLKKRALVVLLTSSRSEGLDELLVALELLRGKHLVVVANLYEQDLSEQQNTLPKTLDAACLYHSVYDHLAHQHRLNVRLSAMPNVYTIHCSPSELPKKLAQCYLSIKQRQR